MKAIHVPRIDARYWAAITMASIFGTNTGDLYAHESGLGIIGGLPVLAAIVAAAYLLERRDTTRHEGWYWLAIIAIRTGATNIADYLCGRRYLGINRVELSVALALLIAALMWRRAPSDKTGLPQTDGRYWLAMLAAGVLGTAAGDAITGFLGGPRGIGGVLASSMLAALLGAVLLYGRGGRVRAVYGYWATVCVARTAGTAIADMLAENTSLNIGLPISTLCTGLVFVGVLVLWKSRPTGEAALV
jgi:uncharacterized membrane-anchored protein